MSKIVIAVNSMISHAEKISEVNIDTKGDELFFKYDDKYVWGIKEDDEDYTLFLYPKTMEVDELVGMVNWNNYPIIYYRTNDLKTRESFETFRELYLIVKEKLYDVNKLLDDIIGDL